MIINPVDNSSVLIIMLFEMIDDNHDVIILIMIIINYYGRSETYVSHGSTKKDRKTKEFPRIDWTVCENGIGSRHGRLGPVETGGTGY